jgi:hypothetical protein
MVVRGIRGLVVLRVETPDSPEVVAFPGRESCPGELAPKEEELELESQGWGSWVEIQSLGEVLPCLIS